MIKNINTKTLSSTRTSIILHIKHSHIGACGIPSAEQNMPKRGDMKQCECHFAFNPVCGSNFVTYQSHCVSKCANVYVANEGSCIRKCGCTQVNKPVCGMNRKTYKNDCEMKCSGIAKLSEGKCDDPKPKGCEHCEGFFSAVCGVNGVTYDNMCYLKCAGKKLFCKTACPSLKKNCKCHERYVPVCGIDNRSYRN